MSSGAAAPASSEDAQSSLRSCKSCRLSKVKCEIPTTGTMPCGRCTRLGFACEQPPVAKRGRPKRESGDMSRLGSAVRKLLQNPEEPAKLHGTDPQVVAIGVPVTNLQTAVPSGSSDDCMAMGLSEVVHKMGDMAMGAVEKLQGRRAGQLHLLRQMIRLSRRSGNVGMRACVGGVCALWRTMLMHACPRLRPCFDAVPAFPLQGAWARRSCSQATWVLRWRK